MYFSLSLLSAFVAVVYGQGQPVAQTTTFGSLPGCSGCYIIADVNQIIFADYTVTQTQTAVASQGVGRNGSVVTTSFNQPLGVFSFDPNGLLSGQPVTGAYVPLTGTVITLDGNTFTSPTAYNVFTGYTEFQLTQVGDTCSTATLPAVSVSPVQIPLGNGGADAVSSAEKAFIAGLPALTCEAGGAVISTTVPVPAVITTTTSTTTGVFRPTPIAASQTSSAAAAATTSAPSSSAASTSDSGIIISMNPSAAGSSAASVSVMQGAAAAFRAYSTSLPTGLFVALFVLPGLGAWIL